MELVWNINGSQKVNTPLFPTYPPGTHAWNRKEAKDKNSANVKVSRSLFRSGQGGWGLIFERREMKRQECVKEVPWIS